MKKSMAVLGLVLMVFALIGPAASWPTYAKDDDDDDEEELLFSKSRFYIEFNSTDEDVGVQVLLDGEPWKKMRMFAPDGHRILDVKAKNSIKQQGVSEFFFESAEPSLDEVSLEEFLERFPEGEYEFEGVTIDGDDIEGEATFTHVIPAGPVFISPVSCDGDLPVVDPNDFVIEWEPVTETITGSEDVDIVGYQLVVEQEEPLRKFSIDVPATTTSVTIPAEFFEQPDTVHVFEVLAIEASGNQTISSAEFVTMP